MAKLILNKKIQITKRRTISVYKIPQNLLTQTAQDNLYQFNENVVYLSQLHFTENKMIMMKIDIYIKCVEILNL